MFIFITLDRENFFPDVNSLSLFFFHPMECEDRSGSESEGSQEPMCDAAWKAILARLYTGTQNFQHDVDDRNAAGRTRLHEACMLGDIQHAKDLRELGADIDARDEDGFTPLMCSVMANNIGVVEWLLSSGANSRLCSYSGITPLRAARLKKYEDIASLLYHRDQA